MEDAHRQFEVNLFGLARITKEVLPAMRQARSGCIVNISSIAGKVHTPFGAWYIASKHALEGWSDCLRLELEQFNIKVVIVEPGSIDTGIADDVLQKLAVRSKAGPYEGSVQKFFNRVDEMAIKGSNPSVVSNVISEALMLKNPPRRYLVGSMAKLWYYTRNWLGDGLWDYLMLHSIR